MVGEGDDQLCGSGRGAIAGCHCSVVSWGEERLTANFGGDAIVACYGWVPVGRPTLGEWTWCQQWHPEKTSKKNCLELLAGLALFSTLITQKLFFLLSGAYGGIFLNFLN